MATKKENDLDNKTTLVNADKIRILDSTDSDSNNITYANLKTNLNADLDFAASSDVIPISIKTAAGSYTILDDDGFTHIVCTATGTITLPTLSDNYNRVITIIRDVASSTTAVIIDGENTETISGNDSEYLYGKYAVIKLIASAAAGEWVYIGTPFDPYIITYDNNSNVAISAPSINIWYNPTSHSISVPNGKWVIDYAVDVNSVFGAGAPIQLFSTLSTSNSSETNLDFTRESFQAASVTQDLNCFNAIDYITVTSGPTTYYILIKVNGSGGLSTLATRGATTTSKIRARRLF